VSGVYLLDVNVLIALVWPNHEAHGKVRHWFFERGRVKWASCPFTQSAFVRILSNPAFSPHALTPADAIQLLHSNLQHPGHLFWPDVIDLHEALRLVPGRIDGHWQVTDAYLLGLTIHNKGRFATLDHKVATLLPGKAEAGSVLHVL
jgi:uncharacterized protein